MNVYIAEFLGTALLVLLGNGVVAGVLLTKSKSENGGWLVIAIGWALAVVFGIFLAGKSSGAHLNPAVTIGLAATGTFSWSLVPGYILAQVLGGLVGSVLVYLHYYPHWEVTLDKEIKRAAFCTSPAIRNAPSNFLSEFIGTFILLFMLSALGANHFADGLNPFAIGLLIASIGLSLGGPTGYAINPARDLAPRLAHYFLPIPNKGDSDWGYAWIPVLGPIAGGVCGALFYQWVSR